MEASHPQGPCPDREELYQKLSSVIDEAGAQNLSFRVLRSCLENEFKVDLSPYTSTIDELVKQKCMQPKTHKALNTYREQVETGTLVRAGVGKKKRKKGVSQSSPKKQRLDNGAPKKKKKERAEGEPKKNLTAFFFFTGDVRAKVKEENPDLGVAQMGRKMGEMWGALSGEEKAVYEKKAVEDKARYDLELQEFIAKGGTVSGRVSKKATKKAAKEGKSGPKKPMTAYFFYLQEHRAKYVEEHPEVKGVTEITKAMSAQWNALPDKSRYEQLNLDDRARYERECAEQGITLKKAKTGGTKRPRKSREADEISSSDLSSSDDSSSDSDSSSSLSSDSDSDFSSGSDSTSSSSSSSSTGDAE